MRVLTIGLVSAAACAWLMAAAQTAGSGAKALVSETGLSSKPEFVSRLEFASSDQRLVQGFDWTKRQASDYVFTDDPVGSWYEAALPGRQAFCMRDTAHQSMGAQALGLSAWTFNMLQRFDDFNRSR